MLHTNGSCILNMSYTASQQLGTCTSCHGTSASHFSLAANLGPGNRGVGLDQVTNKACSGQGTEYFDLRRIGFGLKQIQHCRYYSTGTTGRSGHNPAAGGVFF